MDKPSEQNDEASELGAAEAVSPTLFEQKPASANAEIMCPNCGHPVEAGFKFCDWCGRPLTSTSPASGEPKPPPAPAVPKPPSGPASSEVAKAESRVVETPVEAKPDVHARPVVSPPPAPRPSVSQAELKPPPDIAEPKPPTPPLSRPIPSPPPNIPPPIRSAADTTPTRPILRPISTAPAAAVEERPAPAERVRSSRYFPTFLLQLVGSFVAGAVVLAIVAVVVTEISSGRTGLLEQKGVPVFIGVAVAVAVFAFFRTGHLDDLLGRALAVVGLLVLVGAGTYVYRPVYLHTAQIRLERALKVWSDRDASAVDDFRGDLVIWQGSVADYQRDVAAVVGSHITAAEFRTVAGPTLQSLQEATVSMQTHSTAAGNEKLRDALANLAGVYTDELTGLKLVSTGILTNDFNALRNGDDMYKAARQRAQSVYTGKVRSLLERGGFNTSDFEQALAQ